jgi:hypothetical protein
LVGANSQGHVFISKIFADDQIREVANAPTQEISDRSPFFLCPVPHQLNATREKTAQ